MIRHIFRKNIKSITTTSFYLPFLKDYDDVQVVVLHKEVGVGLGFSLAGGVDQNKPVTVRKIFNFS